MKKIRNNKAITLIALIVTIVILIIISAVTINLLFGDNGVIGRSVEAKFKTHISSVDEKVKMYAAGRETEAIVKNTEYTKIEKTPVKGEKVTSVQGFKDTLVQEIKDISKKDNISDLNIYYIDKDKVEAKLKHEYLIDIDSYQIYDVEGETFKGKCHHTLNSISSNNSSEEPVDVSLIKSNIEFSYNPDTWTNKSVTATATASASLVTTGWNNTSNENYRFEQEADKWTSNNQGIDSSSATSTWTIILDEQLDSYNIKYKVSSELNYDKFTIVLDGVTIVDGISGEGQEEVYTTNLSVGEHTITASYNKDSSAQSADDSAYIILESKKSEINYLLQTSKDGINWNNTPNQVYEQNGIVYAQVKVGNTVVAATSGNIDKIDNQLPIINEIIGKPNYITIKAIDELSGITGYYVSTNNTNPNVEDFTECSNTNNLEKTVNGMQQNTTYYIWVKDAVGNISESKNVNTGIGLDISYNPSGWTNKTVTATAGMQLDWSAESGENYFFIKNGNVWTSNNKGIDNSIATTTWSIETTSNINYDIKYKVSSESSYDKLTIILDDTTIVNEISGEDAIEEIYTANLSAGKHTITASYSKDSSEGRGDDKAYIILQPIVQATTEGTFTVQTSRDGKKWSNETTQVYTENGIIYAKAIDNSNNILEAKTGNIDKIDKVAPIINEISSLTSNIEISATDDASGICGYAITNDDVVPELNNFIECENTKTFKQTVTGNTQETTYYVWVRDEAGNISNSKSTTTQKIPDLTQANLTFTYNPTGWTNNYVTATATTIVTGFTIQTSKDGEYWDDQESQRFSENGTVYARLTDGTNIGGVTTGNIDKIDKNDPTVSITLSTNAIDENDTLAVTFLFSDNTNESGINISNCKYVLNSSSDNIGTNIDDYTGGTFSSIEQTIGLHKENYIHVLASDYAGNNKEFISDILLTQSDIKVGDYINYEPDYNSSYYNLPSTKSGYSIKKELLDGSIQATMYSSEQPINQTIYSDYSLRWRILNINKDGSMDLVSAEPAKGTVNLSGTNGARDSANWVYFGGATGYNNAVYILNDICSTLYSNYNKGIKARSIKIEDIEKLMTEPTLRDLYINENGIAYNSRENPYSSSYPKIYEQENGSGIYEIGTDEVIKTNGLNISEQSNVISYPAYENARTNNKRLSVRQTNYRGSLSSLCNSDVVSVLTPTVTNNSNDFWIASRSVDCYTHSSTAVSFGLFYVFMGNIGYQYLYDSGADTVGTSIVYGKINQFGYLRPIVSLGPDIKILKCRGENGPSNMHKIQ